MTAEFSFIDAKGVRQDFTPHYEQFIKPRIDEFEKKRQAALAERNTRKNRAIIVNVVLNIAIIFSFFFDERHLDWEIILDWLATNLIFFINSFFYVQWPLRKYKIGIKEIIFPLIFKFFGNDFVYSHKPCTHIFGDIENSGIVPDHNSSIFEDLVEGTHNEVRLQLMEAKLKSGGKQSHRSSRNEDIFEGMNDGVVKSFFSSKENNHTVFRGLFIVFSMNKCFSGQTVIKSESGVVGNWLKGVFFKLERVKLEDPNFEKLFEVYSNDQVEARYLLTTSFMERLVSLKNLLKGGVGNFQGSFYENKLLLTIPCEDKFKVGSIHSPVSFKEEIETILKEMQIIFQIIDILKLNQKTGL